MTSKFFGISDDRRALKRYELPLKISYCDPVTKSRCESLTKNISRSGLRFSVNSNLPKGSVLDLKIEDPYSDRPISSKAKIMWLEKFIAGDDAGDIIYEVGVRLLKKRLWN